MNNISFFLFKILIFIFYLQYQTIEIVAQERNINGIPIQNKSEINIPKYFQPSILTESYYNNIRILTEINVENQADAFPWISPNGLKLYYTSGAKKDQLICVQRQDTSRNFFYSTIIPIIVPSWPSSYWLSNDELDVYICTDNYLYYTHRNSITSNFNLPIKINLVDQYYNNVYRSASLNKEQNKLFINVNNYYVNCIFEYTRTALDSFTYSRTLPCPNGYKMECGQLSKDELTYFFSASFNGSKSKLYQITRATPTDSFTLETFQEIQNINESLYYNTQPSMSDSLSWVVFVRSEKDIWDDTDLYIAHKGQISSVYEPKKSQNAISISPNPVNDILHIKFSSEKISNASIRVINELGITVYEKEDINSSMNISTQNFAPGIYFVTFNSGNYNETKKFVVIR